MRILLIVLVIAAAVWAWFEYQANTPEAKLRAAERQKISECRLAQEDELRDMLTRISIRKACDKLEAEYRKKWGAFP